MTKDNTDRDKIYNTPVEFDYLNYSRNYSRRFDFFYQEWCKQLFSVYHQTIGSCHLSGMVTWRLISSAIRFTWMACTTASKGRVIALGFLPGRTSDWIQPWHGIPTVPCTVWIQSMECLLLLWTERDRLSRRGSMHTDFIREQSLIRYKSLPNIVRVRLLISKAIVAFIESCHIFTQFVSYFLVHFALCKTQ